MVPCKPVSQWEEIVSSRMPSLSAPQARGLARWSLGIVLAKCCTLTEVVGLIAHLLSQKVPTVRQCLREWGYEASRKKGARRPCIEVEGCFVWLLRSLVALWPDQDHQIAWALDATTLGKRFTVLSISVVTHGCALPVAWKILGAEEPGSWQPQWLALLDRLQGAVSADWLVLVLADRGLYAKWLYEAIQQRGWHPFLRINRGGKYRQQGHETFLGPRARCSARWGSRGKDQWSVLPDAKNGGAVHCWRVGGGKPRWLVDRDRSASPAGQCGVVPDAKLDRTKLQRSQAGRLAVAAHARE